MSSSESLAKPAFYEGEVICGRWKALREIGRGGCGVVLCVEHIPNRRDDPAKTPTIAALKAETVDLEGKHTETTKMEAHVLRRLQHSEHFCRLFLACRVGENTNIIVMSMVGRSLAWLRRASPSQRFTLSTAIRVSMQCLNAIQELHSQGFLHRDIKGSNFAIGLTAETSRIIHLIDFGFCRPFLVEENGILVMRKPRRKAPFLGTDRYCSVNVHERKEHGRVDDLWSFLFMLVEFIKGKLPWRDLPVEKLKKAKKYFSEFFLEDCPSEMWKILDHLNELTFYSRPEYELIRAQLMEICRRRRFMFADPYDWEYGGTFYRKIRTADIKDAQRNVSNLPTLSELEASSTEESETMTEDSQ